MDGVTAIANILRIEGVDFIGASHINRCWRLRLLPAFGLLSFVKKGPAFTWSTAIPGSPMASALASS